MFLFFLEGECFSWMCLCIWLVVVIIWNVAGCEFVLPYLVWELNRKQPLKVDVVIAIILQTVYSTFISTTWSTMCASWYCGWSPPSLCPRATSCLRGGLQYSVLSVWLGCFHYIWSLLFWINNQALMICVCVYITNRKEIICSMEVLYHRITCRFSCCKYI